MISIDVDTSAVDSMLTKLSNRIENSRPAFDLIGEIITTSVLKNFEEEGRPTPWKPLAQRTIIERTALGYWPGKILARTGFLKRIFHQADADGVTIATQAPYAPKHQYGAGRIPARPFLMIQDEDWVEIRSALGAFLVGGH